MSDLLQFRVACYRFLLRIVRSLRAHLGLERTTYIDRRVPEYRRYWEAAAAALSAEFEALSDSVWEVRRDDARTRIAHYVTEFDNPVTLSVAGDKALVYRLAEAEGIPVPDHVLVGPGTLRAGADFLQRHHGPCVVKPARDTSSGLGVTTYVFSRHALEWAIARASLFCADVIVESHVPGESYRLLFLEGRMIHAVRRRGTRVTGDGVGTVGSLVARAFGEPLDRIAEVTLAAQALSGESVPAPGTSVLVSGLPPGEKRRRELRTVYDEDVTGMIGAGLVTQLQPLVSRVGASFAGVDIVAVDPTLPLREGGAALIEINTTPGIHHHNVPGVAGGRFVVAEVVLGQLLAGAAQKRQQVPAWAGPGGHAAGA
jgi:hypothetical protein